VIANIAERFSQNNFIYTGSREDIEITLINLIRRKGKLEIYSDHHILGLFKLKA
jgi:hypothetical protein